MRRPRLVTAQRFQRLKQNSSYSNPPLPSCFAFNLRSRFAININWRPYPMVDMEASYFDADFFRRFSAGVWPFSLVYKATPHFAAVLTLHWATAANLQLYFGKVTILLALCWVTLLWTMS